jgi:hypothetical protein
MPGRTREWRVTFYSPPDHDGGRIPGSVVTGATHRPRHCQRRHSDMTGCEQEKEHPVGNRAGGWPVEGRPQSDRTTNARPDREGGRTRDPSSRQGYNGTRWGERCGGLSRLWQSEWAQDGSDGWLVSKAGWWGSGSSLAIRMGPWIGVTGLGDPRAALDGLDYLLAIRMGLTRAVSFRGVACFTLAEHVGILAIGWAAFGGDRTAYLLVVCIFSVLSFTEVCNGLSWVPYAQRQLAGRPRAQPTEDRPPPPPGGASPWPPLRIFGPKSGGGPTRGRARSAGGLLGGGSPLPSASRSHLSTQAL